MGKGDEREAVSVALLCCLSWGMLGWATCEGASGRRGSLVGLACGALLGYVILGQERGGQGVKLVLCPASLRC